MSRKDAVEDEVRRQYEQYPYPERKPEDEAKRLVPTVANFLAKINFYCFQGRSRFQDFRALVAGAGTGDAVIFLAEQLRGRDAEVVYLDPSRASMEIAQRRAAVRGLDNIVWLQHSLFDIPQLDIGEFDYINCSGVLHHLEDPPAGLKTLTSVLREDGAMSIMLYGKYGRTGVYQLQALLRLINGDDNDLQAKIANTRKVLQDLPPGNWFRRGAELFDDPLKDSDIEVYDLLLHAQDRAYSIPELYEFVRNGGLNFVDFACGQKQLYNPANYLRDRSILERIARLDRELQHSVAELLSGAMIKHVFYLSKRNDSVAQIDDLDNIPFYFRNLDQQIFQMIANNPGREITLPLADGTRPHVLLGRHSHHVLRQIDGKRTLAEILDRAAEQVDGPRPSSPDLLEDFRPAYNWLNEIEALLLRHRTVAPYESVQDMQRRLG